MTEIFTSKKLLKNQSIIGESCESYLDTLKEFSEEEIKNLRKETLNIFDSFRFNNDTALVVGRVQSGKTTSFINLSAIAHDNNIPLVIIIGGISKTLTSQTFDETQKLSDSDYWSSIYVSSTSDIPGVMSPKDVSFKDEISNNLKNFDSVPKELKKSQLLVVMKEDDNLEHLKTALKKISHNILNNKKVLIIDDEVDQYGLNSKFSEDSKSTIYQKIEELRNVFNNHTYVGYTATPQANLLISLKDIMSPDYLYSITPGKNYVGGDDLFLDLSKSNKNLEIINEFHIDDDTEKIPDSLKKALLEFCIIVTNSIFANQDPKKPVTMLIHPSHLKESHRIHCYWVKTYLDNLQIRSKNEIENDLKEEITKIHTFFSTRNKDFINLGALLENIPFVFNEIKIKEQNTRSTGSIERIDWKDKAYIIIAGMNADRGTQIKGLVVTYLSRSTGAARMDTLQQRARFFGYKRSYLNLIRIFITEESAKFFHNYIEHEKYLHQQIHKANGKMPDVRKLYKLDGFDFTRPGVFDGGVYIKKKEYSFRSQKPFNSSYVDKNSTLVKNFLSKHFLNFTNNNETHPSVFIDGEDIYNLLFELRYGDSIGFHKMKIVFELIYSKNLKDNLENKYQFYLMNNGKERVRSVVDGSIEQLLQGPASDMRKESAYPGDSAFQNERNISFQLHNNQWKGRTETAWSIVMFIPKKLRDELKELNIFITDR